MKKLTLFVSCAIIIGTIAALAACYFEPFVNKTQEPPKVFYSEDGSQITIAINGNQLPPELAVKAASSRALTNIMAQRSHDFFEVVFKGPTGIVAKTTWPLGEPAVIYGVDTADVDYSTADGNSGTDGAAILFVGRQSDRTLLGVGLLTASTRTNAAGVTSPSGTVITSETSTVTFTVAALEGGAGFTTATSSFVLDAAERPIIRTIKTDEDLTFPMFVLEADRPSSGPSPTLAIPATYTLTCTDPDSLDLADYLPGMFIRNDAGTNRVPRVNIQAVPRYTFAGQIRTLIGEPAEVEGIITNNNTAKVALTAGINFAFETKAPVHDVASIASFNFQVPVYPIDEEAGTWFIRNGFGTNNMNLDNGDGGLGGAILLGIGDPTGIGINVNGNWLVVSTPPANGSVTGIAIVPPGTLGELTHSFGGSSTLSLTADLTVAGGGTATNSNVTWTLDATANGYFGSPGTSTLGPIAAGTAATLTFTQTSGTILVTVTSADTSNGTKTSTLLITLAP